MTIIREYSNPTNIVPKDVSVIDSAKVSIDFAAYALVEPLAIAALTRAAQRGVVIRLYLDRSELCAEAHHDDTGVRLPAHPLTIQPAVTSKVKHSIILMHLKSYCVDSAVVRSGSANFSTLGETQQDNEASWDDDPDLVAQFRSKFEQMWARPDNLTIAQAIDLNRVTGVVPTHQHSH